jgi:hypothetical protein
MMLENAKKDGLEQIVSWVQCGSTFEVHDAGEVVPHIMPFYFDQEKKQSAIFVEAARCN